MKIRAVGGINVIQVAQKKKKKAKLYVSITS